MIRFHHALRFVFSVLVAALLLPATAAHASPNLHGILPRGGQRGTEVDVVLAGNHLKDAEEILFYSPGITVTKFEPGEKQLKAHFKIAADAALGQYALRVRSASGISELHTFWVGPFPIVDTAKKLPLEFESPQKIPLNVTVTGVINNEQVHYFQVEAKKGQRLSVEVEGMRLGEGMFDPYIAIYDTKHFELAACDDTPLLKQDPFASILAPKDASYIIAVRDSSFGGGPDFYYLMHVGTFPRPHVLFPCGGQAGQSVEVQYLGDINGPITQTLHLPPNADGPLPFYAQQEKQSPPSPNAFRVCPFPNVMAVKPNNDLKSATPAGMEPPLAFNGIIATPGQTDFFRFGAKKDHSLDITVYARRLGSPLDSVITLFAADGKRLATNDDSGGPDSYLRFNPPADGDYVVSIRDHLREGGPDYVYRIEVTPPKKSVALTIPPANQNNNGPSQERQTIVVPRGNRFATLMRATRANVGSAFTLSAPNLPAGLTMECGPVDPNQVVFPVIFEATADAPVSGKLCDLIAKPADAKEQFTGGFEQQVELVTGGNNTAFYSVDVEKMAVAVVREVPFTLKIVEPKVPIVQGGAMGLRVVAERKPGFDKQISVRLLYKPQGLGSAGQTTDIPAGQNEVVMALTASADTKAGKYPMVVLGSIDLDGKAWVSSPVANLEVEKPYASMKLQMAAGEQGQNALVACEIQPRTPFDGKAKVELLGLPANTSVEPQEIEATDKKVVFTVTIDPKAQPGTNNSLFCRLTVMKDGQAIVHNLAQGGVLRIDPNSQSKKAAPKSVAQGQPPTTAPTKVLSRLEKLRQEQTEDKQQ